MMEVKEIYQKLHQFVNEVTLGYKGEIDLNLLREAADRLEKLEAEKENLIDYNADLNKQLDRAESHIEKLEKQLSEKQEWISVKERLPNESEFVLVSIGDKEVGFAMLEEMTWYTGNNRILEGVTHWMPLPEPPKPQTQKFRKKPVVVEAYQTEKELVIHTLEGDMTASVGDYIITGVDGEQYPCKPDIFEKTYEPYFEEEGEAE